MNNSGKFVVAGAAAIAIFATPAAAKADQKILLDSGAWRAVEATQGGHRLCFVIASPTSRAPAELKRDPGNLFVTTKAQREGGGSEVSIRFGYRLGQGPHTLTIEGRSFSLMPQGETAWLRSAADEQAVVAAMRSGRDLSIAAVSARGNTTTDSYSLIGFSAALEALQRQCRP